jgi:hypothetical protein
MLKAVKHLSMNPTLLEVLQNANAIEILTRILDEQSSGPHSTVCCFRLGHGWLPMNSLSTGNGQPHLPDLLQPLPLK